MLNLLDCVPNDTASCHVDLTTSPLLERNRIPRVKVRILLARRNTETRRGRLWALISMVPLSYLA